MIRVEPGNVHVALSEEQGEEEFMKVTVDETYYLAATLVTQGQWLAVTGDAFRPHCADNYPMTGQGQSDILEFCRRLTEMDLREGKLPKGYIYTLPNEMQWEYACRAGTTGDHAGPIDHIAWHRGNAGGELHPVARKQPNRWGFFDMHGNALEWCREPCTNVYAFRGGYWRDSAYFCRSGMRLKRSISMSLAGVRPVAVPEKSAGGCR